jgi:hypothetical protein
MQKVVKYRNLQKLMNLNKYQGEMMPVEQDYNDFKDELFRIADKSISNRDSTSIDYEEHTNSEKNKSTMTFYFEMNEECAADKFIRSVRDELLSYPELSKICGTNAFIYKVLKENILSASCWSVIFSLSEKYELIESYQH